jgi:hypothetical protein
MWYRYKNEYGKIIDGLFITLKGVNYVGVIPEQISDEEFEITMRCEYVYNKPYYSSKISRIIEVEDVVISNNVNIIDTNNNEHNVTDLHDRWIPDYEKLPKDFKEDIDKYSSDSTKAHIKLMALLYYYSQFHSVQEALAIDYKEYYIITKHVNKFHIVKAYTDELYTPLYSKVKKDLETILKYNELLLNQWIKAL